MKKPSKSITMKRLKGDLIPGDNGKSITELPKWLDKEKFERAKSLYLQNCSAVSFGHLSGLFMIFLYTKRIEPFQILGEISVYASLLRRYISTAEHVRKWYTGDIWNLEDPARKSLQIVRNMHKGVANKMNAERSGENFLYVSQFSMSMTQFAFMGMIILFPRRMGISWGKKDMEAFIHFWRCIGYILGMDDEYNICSGNYEETLELFLDILENEVKPGIRDPRKESVRMARDIVTVLSCANPLLTWESLSVYWGNDLDIPRDFVMSYVDLLCYWSLKAFSYLAQFILVRNLLNVLSVRLFDRIYNNMSYYEKCVQKYEDKCKSRNEVYRA